MNKLGNAIGTGLLAGFAGTAAMTISSTAEARLRGRPGPGFFRGVKRSTSELAAQLAPQEFPHVVVWQLVAEHDALRHT